MTRPNEFMRARREVRDDVPDYPVLFLGEDNPQSPLDAEALWPHNPLVAGARLQRILGLPIEHYLGVWRTNLVLDAAQWNTAGARTRASAVLNAEDPPWRVIVFLGKKVLTACECAVMSPFTFVRRGAQTLVAMPHPSGRARAWNDKDAVDRARQVLQKVSPELPIGTWAPP